MSIKDYYVYGVNFLAVAAGATQTQTLAIQADSDFEVLKLTFASNLNAAVQTANSETIPQASILIVDTGSGRQLMNQAIDLTTMFGNARNPFIIPTPKRFRANSAITFALTNYSTAEVYNIRLSLHGNKIFG